MLIDASKVVWDEEVIDPAKVTWDKETPALPDPTTLAKSTVEIASLVGAGIKPEPETFLGRVRESWETGELQTELGILRYRQIIGEDLPEIESRITELKARLPKQPPIKRGLPERAVRAAAEMLPIQISGMRKGAQRGLTFGMTAGAATALAGQIGPQAALPEEIITVPSAFAAGYGVGMLSGTLENIAQIEAGLAYDELVNLKDKKGNKLDPTITKSAAAGVGIINGLIELAQIKLLLKTIPGGEAILRGAIRKATTKAVKSKALHRLAFRAAKRHGVFVTAETSQEIAQESTNILANETAKFFSNEIQKKTDIPYATRQEIAKRLVQTAEQSALAFTVMGVPGQAVQVTAEVIKPGAPIPVQAELVEKGMPKEEITEPTIIRQQKVARDEAVKQEFLANIAEYVEAGEIGPSEVAFMGKSPQVQAMGITQEELNAVAGKVVGDAVATSVTEDMAVSGQRAFDKFLDEVEEVEPIEVEPEPEKVAPREPTEKEAALLEKVEPLEVEPYYEPISEMLQREGVTATRQLVEKAAKSIREITGKKPEVKKVEVTKPEEKAEEPPVKEVEKPTASFLGWQETAEGDHIALYNIESGPKTGTTVTIAGLKREGIAVPKATTEKPKIKPPVEEKVEEVGKKVAPKVKEPWEMTREEFLKPIKAAAYRNKVTGEIIEGTPTEVHFEILERKNIPFEEIGTKYEDGFVGKDGEFLTKDEAQKLVKRPDRKTQLIVHKEYVAQAISEGKITSHPDYPELGKAIPEAKEAWEMTLEELSAEKGYKVGKLPGEDIARMESDGIITVDKDKFFGHGIKERKSIIEHEQAHFIEEKISPEYKARLFDNKEVMAYRGRNINEKLANMIQDNKLPKEILADYPELGEAKKEPWEIAKPEIQKEFKKIVSLKAVDVPGYFNTMYEIYQKGEQFPSDLKWPVAEFFTKHYPELGKVEIKKSWEMTFAEFLKEHPIGKKPEMSEVDKQANHKIKIRQALKEKKPVPHHVLEEYKDEQWAKEALGKVEGEKGIPKGFIGRREKDVAGKEWLVIEKKPTPPEPKVEKKPTKLTILKDKKGLLAEIDKAIEEAPDAPDLTPLGPVQIKKMGTVHFDIDGGANIINAKQPLQIFRQKIAKTAEGAPIKKFPLPTKKPGLPKPTGKKPEITLEEEKWIAEEMAERKPLKQQLKNLEKQAKEADHPLLEEPIRKQIKQVKELIARTKKKPAKEKPIPAKKVEAEIPPPTKKMPDYLSLNEADIKNIEYDYEGPGGTQRKVADTKHGAYIFHKEQGQWILKETKPKGIEEKKKSPEVKIPPRPLVNPKASYLQQDKQKLKQQAWDKKYGQIDETRLAMAGEKAIGAPTGALAKAQEMLAKGEKEESVWKETGWMKGAEGKWKWEIDDSGAKFKDLKELKDKEGDVVKFPLATILEHPKLFKAYPSLEDLTVTLKEGAPEGSFDGKEVVAWGTYDDHHVKTLLHELQHVIQAMELFAKGGDPQAIAQELATKESRHLRETNETYRDLDNKINDLYFEGEPLGSHKVDMYYRQMQEILDKHLVKKYGKEHPAVDIYKRLAGEIEAREAAVRKGISPEMRRIMPPYAFTPIPREDWIIRDGTGTSFSVEPALAAEPEGYKFTKRQQKDLIKIGQLIPQWMQKAGADWEILQNITIELKPFIDLKGRNVDKTLKDWEKEGVDAGKVVGATSLSHSHALVQLAINGQKLSQLERSTYHEWYHIAKAWMLPQSDINALAKHFKTEESEADAFAAYMKDAKSIRGEPSFIRRLFMKLKRMLTIIRNGLNAKGFTRAEDIFGSIRVGAYKPVRGAKPITAVGLTPALKLAIEKRFFQAVAVRAKSGKIYKGTPGEIHADVKERMPFEEKTAMMYEDSGFVNQEGKFYSRSEAVKAVNVWESEMMAAKGLMPETRLAMEKKPPTISKEEKTAEEYIQKALGKVKETKVIELKPTEEITGPAYDKIVEQEAQKPIDQLIKEALDDERLVHHVRSTLKKAMSIGKKEGIAKQKGHYRAIVARAKARKEQVARIRKMVDSLKQIDVEKMSPQEAEPVSVLLTGLNLVKPTKKTIIRLTRTREYLEKDHDAELPEYVMESLKRLNKRNIRDMSVEEIEAIHTGVMHYVHLNKVKNIIKVRREARRKAEVLASSIGEMKAPKQIKSDIVSSQKGKAGRLKKTTKLLKDTFGIRHDHYDLIIESLSGMNSTMDKVLYQDIKDGITEQLKYKQDTYAQFLKDVGDFSEKYGIKDISNWLNEEVTVGKFQLSRGERMAILRHTLNVDNLRHLLAGGFGFRTSETPNVVYKITAKDLNQVLQSLTPAEKHFAGTAVNNLFERQYERLNKVFYQKNGYPLPKTKDPYYPIEVMPITLGTDLETVDALEKFKGVWTRIGLEKGMLEKRVKSRKPIYLNSIVFDINRSVMKSAAYIGLEIPLSNASKLLYDQTFRVHLEDRYGKQTWREIEKGLRDIAGDYQSYTTVEEMVLKLKNNLSVAMLGINPFVMTKQVLSLPVYLPYVKLEYLLQGMIDFTVHPIEVSERHKMYSPEYLERVEGGYSRDVADVFKGAAMKRLYKGKGSIKEKFMGGIQLFDRVAVSAGMQGAALQALDEFDQGKLSREVKIALDMKDADIAKLTPAEKMELAYKFADYATERTQPMFSPEHRSSLSRGATIEKMATMFGAFTNQALNLMRRTYREARRTGEPAAYAKLAKTLFLILVVNTLGVMSIDEIRNRLYKKKDRPSIAGRILNTWAGYMFFVRDIANSVISKVEKGTFLGYDVELPVQRVPELLSNVLANGVKMMSDKTHSKRKKAAVRFFDDGLNLLLTMQGIPYATPKRMLMSALKPEKAKAVQY